MNGQIRGTESARCYIMEQVTHKVISLNNIIKKTDHKSINKLNLWSVLLYIGFVK